jgi:hypothetical protein
LIGNLVMADVDAAFAYAECQAKHQGVVQAYEAARQGLK